MPAIPAASASRQAFALARFTPPSASTRKLEPVQASRNAASPIPLEPVAAFSKIGARAAKLAPFASASRTSATEWAETPTRQVLAVCFFHSAQTSEASLDPAGK